MVKDLGKQSLFLAKFNFRQCCRYSFDTVSFKMVQYFDFLMKIHRKNIAFLLKTISHRDKDSLWFCFLLEEQSRRLAIGRTNVNGRKR